MVTSFSSELKKLSEERVEIQDKDRGDHKVTPLNNEKNEHQGQKRKKVVEVVEKITHRAKCCKLWSTVEGV